MQVTTKVNKFGMETLWMIRNGGGNVFMRMGPAVPAYSLKTVKDCLPAGGYNFKISNIDGICCKNGEGRYAIAVNGMELLDGGLFIGSEMHKIRLGYDWVSGMSECACEWWWGHHVRRKDWHTRCYAKYCRKDYRHLKWSAALEADARKQAEQLLDMACNGKLLTENHDHNTKEGENMAKNKGLGSWGELFSAKCVMVCFVNNEEFLGCPHNAHLTQAIWYAMRYIGCADSARDMGGGVTCRMQVCRYMYRGTVR